MGHEKSFIRRGRAPCASVFVGAFCSALVRLCGELSVITSASSPSQPPPAAGTPKGDASLSAFDFVSAIVLALASRRLISCVDPVAYRLEVGRKARELRDGPARDTGAAEATHAVEARGTKLGSLLFASAGTGSGGMPSDSASSEPRPLTEEEQLAVADAHDRLERRRRHDAWVESVRAAYRAASVATTDDEPDYFEARAVLEFGLLEVHRRLDAAYAGHVTMSRFLSFLSDCSTAASNVSSSDGARGAGLDEMLLAPIDCRHAELDTAVAVVRWPQRRMVVALSSEHFKQSVGVLDAASLNPWRKHSVNESVGKVLGIAVLPVQSCVALLTYSGVRIHDAENWLCKAILQEKELVSCVRWVPAAGALLLGTQAGEVVEYNLDEMERTFFATHKPCTSLPRRGHKVHTEIVTDILAETPTSFVVSASMDGTIVMRHRESNALRVFRGCAVVGMCLAEHLGLLLAFGVDSVPFAFSFNVPESAALAFGESGTRGHPGRIVNLGLLDDDNFAVSVDRTGGVRVWDLVRNTCVHSVGVTDHLEGVKYLAFHTAVISARGVEVIARRRRFRLPFNFDDFGRVPPKAAQSAVTCVAVDHRTTTCILGAGLDVQWWGAVAGRLIKKTSVAFLSAPSGAPHGSNADSIAALELTQDGRQLVVASDKYAFNVLCSATGACRSRHALPLEAGTLLRACPIPVLDIPDRPAEGYLLSFRGSAPKLLMHAAMCDALAGAMEDGGSSSPNKAQHGPRGGGAKLPPDVGTTSHALDRLVLASTSDSLRIRLSVFHWPLGAILCALEQPAVSRHSQRSKRGARRAGTAGAEEAECRTLTVWRRLATGAWTKASSVDLPESIVSITVPTANPTAAPASSPRHFAVVTADGMVHIGVIDVANLAVSLEASFAHRSVEDGDAALAVQPPSALRFHPSHPRLLCIGDDLGTVVWYDVGGCLHDCRLPPPASTPSLRQQDAAECRDDKDGGSSNAGSSSTDVVEEGAMTVASASPSAGSSPMLPPFMAPQVRACIHCGLEDDTAAADASVWRLARHQKAHADAVSSLDFVTVPGVKQPLLLSAAYDGTVHMLALGVAAPVASLVDTSKRLSGGRPPPAFELAAAATPALPEWISLLPLCSTDGHGAAGYLRCTSASVPLIQALPRRAGHASARHADSVHSARFGSQDISTVGSPGGQSSHQSPDGVAATFLTDTAAEQRLPIDVGDAEIAEEESYDDEDDLPPLRSIRGLGLSREQCVALYKEWVFGRQLELDAGRRSHHAVSTSERVERLQRLHELHASTVDGIVEELLRTDDRFFEEAKSKRSPRISPTSAPARSTTGHRTTAQGKALPSLATLRRLARPGGAIRRDVTDAVIGPEKHLELPPQGRVQQVVAQRRLDVVKAQFDFKARVDRTAAQREAALQTLEEMPREDFMAQLRSDAAAASRMEASVRAANAARQRAARRRGAATSPGEGDLESPRRGPVAFPAAGKQQGSTEPAREIKHARAVGGAKSRQRVPKYLLLARSEASTPPPPQPSSSASPQYPRSLSPIAHASTPEPHSHAHGFAVPVRMHARPTPGATGSPKRSSAL